MKLIWRPYAKLCERCYAPMLLAGGRDRWCSDCRPAMNRKRNAAYRAKMARIAKARKAA